MANPTETMTAEEFTRTIINDTTGQKFIVKFGATWCNPCKIMTNILDKLAPDLLDYALYSMDTDITPELADSLGIKTVPALFMFQNGEQIRERYDLAVNTDGVMNWVNGRAIG